MVVVHYFMFVSLKHAVKREEMCWYRLNQHGFRLVQWIPEPPALV
jgi:hypothetical protein